MDRHSHASDLSNSQFIEICEFDRGLLELGNRQVSYPFNYHSVNGLLKNARAFDKYPYVPGTQKRLVDYMNSKLTDMKYDLHHLESREKSYNIKRCDLAEIAYYLKKNKLPTLQNAAMM